MEERRGMDFQRMWFELKRVLVKKAEGEETGSYKKAFDTMQEVEMEQYDN